MLATILPLVAAVTATPETVIPFELVGGRIFVRAYVNGQGPFRFGVDTGASGVGRADSRLVEKLDLPVVEQVQNSDGVATVTSPIVELNSLRLGKVEMQNVKVIARDYNGPGSKPDPMLGIIARDFFADRLMILNYPARTLTLTDGALDPRARGVVRYGPGFAISVCFAAACFPGKIDTGSNRSVVVPKEVAAKIAAGPPVFLEEAKRTNGTSRLYEVPVTAPARLSSVSAKEPKVIYAEPYGTTINVGTGFLQDFVLVIDQRNKLLQIRKAKATDSRSRRSQPAQ